MYAEDSDDIYLSVWCYDNRNEKSVQFDWGERRPVIADDPYEIRLPDGTLHSSSHPVRVRYGKGIAQSESWQLFSPDIASRNRSLPGAYVGDGTGRAAKYQQVDTLTVWTDTETGDSIEAEFDVRRLGKALSRLDRHCR